MLCLEMLQCSHHGQFQAVKIVSLNTDLGRDVHYQLSEAGASSLLHSTRWALQIACNITAVKDVQSLLKMGLRMKHCHVSAFSPVCVFDRKLEDSYGHGVIWNLKRSYACVTPVPSAVTGNS